jgi:hypothetical protein
LIARRTARLGRFTTITICSGLHADILCTLSVAMHRRMAKSALSEAAPCLIGRCSYAQPAVQQRLSFWTQGPRQVTPTAVSFSTSAGNSDSRPQTPPSSCSAHNCSAFSRSPSTKLPPLHLSTVGRRELVLWINDVLDLDLKDISQVQPSAAAI